MAGERSGPLDTTLVVLCSSSSVQGRSARVGGVVRARWVLCRSKRHSSGQKYIRGWIQGAVVVVVQKVVLVFGAIATVTLIL